MKQANNSRRSRGRGNGKRQPRTNNVDSHGPDVRVRGTVHQVHDKYLTLARDATSSGDRIAAENYYQHAEHYQRIIAAQQENAEQRQDNRDSARDNSRNRKGRNGSGDSRNSTPNPATTELVANSLDSNSSSETQGEQAAEMGTKNTGASGTEGQEVSEAEAQVEPVVPESDGDAEQPSEQATA